MPHQKYKSIFEEAGKLYRTDWRLIAALGYQESHWNPKALSPTGVKGLMMLTKPTASRLGVTNRYDARQNIFAATKYLNTFVNPSLRCNVADNPKLYFTGTLKKHRENTSAPK